MSKTASLDAIEQYRLQMAAISTAAFGYWKEGDIIRPEYDTQALHDVAKLYAKYSELHAAIESWKVSKWTAPSGNEYETRLEAVANGEQLVTRIYHPVCCASEDGCIVAEARGAWCRCTDVCAYADEHAK